MQKLLISSCNKKHSEYSLLDGLAKISEYAERSKKIEQDFLCITDHAVLGAIPQQIAECDKHDLKPIFGCEFYINRMQQKTSCREESSKFRECLDETEKKNFDKSNHLLAIAYNQVGYKNLVQLCSWSWLHGFYRRPRITFELLKKHKEGLIITSGCCLSEIAQAYFNSGDEAGFAKIEEYLEVFGSNFYLELMMLDFRLQAPYDAFLIRAHDKYNIPMVLSQDVHYAYKEHSKYQRLMLMMKSRKTVQDIETLIAAGETEDIFELQDTNLWMKSETDLNEKWESDYSQIIDYDIFKTSKANTVKICELAKGVELDRTIKLPVIENEKEKLLDLIKQGVIERGMPKTKVYLDRIKEEYSLICEKGFSSYFLIEKQMVDEAIRVCPELYGWPKELAYLSKGPGRGSLAGSLVAYLLNLHDLDPIQHNLLFSRFLSPTRGGVAMKTRFTIPPIS